MTPASSAVSRSRGRFGNSHARRCTFNAVHTQGGAHKRRSLATAGVLLFKGGAAKCSVVVSAGRDHRWQLHFWPSRDHRRAPPPAHSDELGGRGGLLLTICKSNWSLARAILRRWLPGTVVHPPLVIIPKSVGIMVTSVTLLFFQMGSNVIWNAMPCLGWSARTFPIVKKDI